jgi:flagellar protein FlaG
MVDQVNPTGSLAPGTSLTFVAISRPQPVQDKPKAAKPAEAPSQEAGDGRGESAPATLDAAVQAFSEYLRQSKSDLVFQTDASSGKTYFKIVDSKTQEVIRQVPSEEILAMARKLRELANPKGAQGVLVDREG